MTNAVQDSINLSESQQTPLPGEMELVAMFKKAYTGDIENEDIFRAREIIEATPELKQKQLEFFIMAAGRESITLDYRDYKENIDPKSGIDNAYTWYGKVSAERIDFLQNLGYSPEEVNRYVDELIYRSSWGGDMTVKDFNLFVSELGLDKNKYESTISNHLFTRAFSREYGFAKSSTQDIEEARRILGTNYNKSLLSSLDLYMKQQMQTDLEPAEIGALNLKLKAVGKSLGLEQADLSEATKLLYMWEHRIGSEYLRYTQKGTANSNNDFRRN